MVKSHNSISIFIISNENIFGFKERKKTKIKTTKALKKKEEKDIQRGEASLCYKRLNNGFKIA